MRASLSGCVRGKGAGASPVGGDYGGEPEAIRIGRQARLTTQRGTTSATRPAYVCTLSRGRSSGIDAVIGLGRRGWLAEGRGVTCVATVPAPHVQRRAHHAASGRRCDSWAPSRGSQGECPIWIRSDEQASAESSRREGLTSRANRRSIRPFGSQGWPFSPIRNCGNIQSPGASFRTWRSARRVVR